MGQHVKKQTTDPVEIWFFVVLVALGPAIGTLIWVLTG